jgi:hypothetical protein
LFILAKDWLYPDPYSFVLPAAHKNRKRMYLMRLKLKVAGSSTITIFYAGTHHLSCYIGNGDALNFRIRISQ